SYKCRVTRGSRLVLQGGGRGHANPTYFPLHFAVLVALMRRASLTSSLIAPVIGSESRALSVRSATICMSLSSQVNEIMSHSLSASEAPELISNAARSFARAMTLDSASTPASVV